MKENLKLGLILLIITSIAGFCLGEAYSITREPIEKQAIMANIDALKETLPDADDFKKKDVSIPAGSVVKEAYEGLSNGKSVGYAIKVTSKGFKGEIEIMVGISPESKKISGIKIISNSETAGLGANSTKPEFYGQFKGKSINSPLKVVKGGNAKDGEIDAIAGATITSNGVTDGVNEAVKFYASTLKGGENK
jgi:electron transport complex protein RnfG